MQDDSSKLRRCPALLISAPASNQGKTVITAGLARYHRRQGRRVRVFKVGPDFLDPMILEQASGNSVGQLDLWMGGEAHCRKLLYEAAADADLIIVEGVMGLFDGTPSSGDLAESFGLPVLLVINASSMMQTFHAVAHGLATYRTQLNFIGVVANNVASQKHEMMLSAPESTAIKYLGSLLRADCMKLPERHLGLVQANEIKDLEARLDTIADAIADTQLVKLPDPVEFTSPDSHIDAGRIEPLLSGRTIAIAKDQAFSFIYPANLETLEKLGARLVTFSPLAGEPVPVADAVYLPGGYPELYLAELGAESPCKQSLREHFNAGKVIYAECGGMLYALESLTDRNGCTAPMLGLLAGHAIMQNKLSALGYQELDSGSSIVRGHTFHYSSTCDMPEPSTYCRRAYDGKEGEAVYQAKGLWTSYVHLYFPSAPHEIAALFSGTARVQKRPLPFAVKMK